MVEPNAILAISSLDRYTKPGRNGAVSYVNQPVSNSLVAQYNDAPPYANDFSINAPGALMNGYIDRIIVDQIQLQYNLPTVVPTFNDVIPLFLEASEGAGEFIIYDITLPYGFYNPLELGAMFELRINSILGQAGAFSVEYTSLNTYLITSNTNRTFYFPTPDEMVGRYSTIQIVRNLKAYKLFGFNTNNQNPSLGQQSWTPPQFLYTPYIDIYSDVLTNYQKLKDTDSSITKSKGLIARIYLAGESNPQFTSSYLNPTTGTFTFTTSGESITGTTSTSSPMSTSFGSAPFVLTYALNNPKVINWSRDSAINSIDFQVRDCYGDLLFASINAPGTAVEAFQTEFQMTLLCIEG